MVALPCIHEGTGYRDGALVLRRPFGKRLSQREKISRHRLDCSGAFDRIKFSSSKKALDAAESPAMIVGWYNQVLTGRLLSADLQGAHNTIIPIMGSLQGGVLSPLVWIIVMNSLLSTFPREGVKAIGYADGYCV